MDKPLALIVEEDPRLAAMFQQTLDKAGFQTETISHERLDFERLSNRIPWLVLLDLDSPGFSGNRILEVIRKHDRLRQIKVIAVTSLAQMAESLSAEPDLLLFKPVESEQFSELLERFKLKIRFQTTIPMIGEPWDRVTGVYNELFFRSLLERSLLQAKESGRYLFAVLTVSFDQDNSVKDKLEIKNWISALRATAESLKTTVRPADVIARFNQDNFYILIDNIPDNEIPRMVASRIRKNLRDDLAGLGNDLQFPIRVSVLLCNHRYGNVDMILADAKGAQVPAGAERDENSKYSFQTPVKYNAV